MRDEEINILKLRKAWHDARAKVAAPCASIKNFVLINLTEHTELDMIKLQLLADIMQDALRRAKEVYPEIED